LGEEEIERIALEAEYDDSINTRKSFWDREEYGCLSLAVIFCSIPKPKLKASSSRRKYAKLLHLNF